MRALHDSHIHSSFSTDSTTPMEDMAQAAVSLGLKGIAITDHYHPDYPIMMHRTGQPTAAYHQAMERTRERFQNQLDVRFGLEIGVLIGKTLPVCQAAANDYPYDILLAAFHSTRTKPFDYLGNERTLSAEELCVYYYKHVLRCIRQFRDYDVLAHVNLVDRYVDRLPREEAYLPLLDEIFKLVIRDGKGIEINTSSYRYGMGERTTPTLAMLRRYRELGGEIVTVGSDAHAPEWVGSHLEEGYELLQAAGWNYYAIYKNRKPVFLPLT